MTKMLIIEPDAHIATTLESLVTGTQGDVACATSLRDTTLQGVSLARTVVVFGPGLEWQHVVGAAREVLDVEPSARVIAVVNHVTTDLLRQAMHTGIADVVGMSDATSEIRDVIARALAHCERLAEQAVSPEAESANRGEVVTVFSTKGGVGKTVLSTNLGVGLASRGRSVVLVDLDLQFGDVGIMLGLEPTQTISGPAQANDRLDAEFLAGHLVAHGSGLKCLLAPVQPEEAEAITPGRITRILDLLTQMYDYVVVDTSASLDETVLTALDRSDHVLALTMMDVASIKNTRISLQKLHQLGYDGDLLEVVLNRADSKVYLQLAQVEKAVGRDIRVRIPSDRIVPQSVNKGVPVVLEAPKSDVARALMSIVDRLGDDRTKVVREHVA